MTGQQGAYVQVFVTFPDRESAARVAQVLVAESLAGCVQIVGPIQSVYRWEGKIESAEEWLCLIKTPTSRYAQLEQRIRQMHSYQVPEIIAVPITAGSSDYLTWLSAATGETSPAS
ncbi:MAG: divalent-cation tolerance protein CutA [Thermogutta sp.]|uniref:divalent-cation tolerance protein CutA n=1 Tax=Thermogutta sp. TaxID=1962930 RepID=UPI0019BFEA2B|nr:divalent-cation tolerance protein CutA [Thermogutta sp.]MBC7351340.1 divalent-cation tolerance protein CutA [Thermogutta sp.]